MNSIFRFSFLAVFFAGLAFADQDPACIKKCQSYHRRCMSMCNINDLMCHSNCGHSYRRCVYQCPDVAPISPVVVGSKVEITEDSNTYYGTKVVGQVKKGERYQVRSVQGNWVSLKTMEDAVVPGWINFSKLKLIE